VRCRANVFDIAGWRDIESVLAVAFLGRVANQLSPYRVAQFCQPRTASRHVLAVPLLAELVEITTSLVFPQLFRRSLIASLLGSIVEGWEDIDQAGACQNRIAQNRRKSDLYQKLEYRQNMPRVLAGGCRLIPRHVRQGCLAATHYKAAREC